MPCHVRNHLPLFFRPGTQCSKRTISGTTGVGHDANTWPAGLDLQKLEESVHLYFSKGLASST